MKMMKMKLNIEILNHLNHFQAEKIVHFRGITNELYLKNQCLEIQTR